MIRIKNILAGLAVAVPALSAQAYPEILKEIEEHAANCNKYPTPDAQAACQQKVKESKNSYDRHLQQEAAREKAAQPNFKKPASDKPSGLCFTRKATGEVVCPN